MVEDITNEVEKVESVDRDRDETIDKLDEFFGMLSSGVSVVIERLKPSWCSGFLEEVPWTEDFGLEYLINTWGGSLLSLKMRGKKGQLGGTYKVPLYSYPPLRFGRKLKPYDQGEKFDEDKPAPPAAPPAPVVVNPSAPLENLMSALPAIIPLVTKIMDGSEARRQADMAMMMQMMKLNSGGGIGDITKIGAVMSQLSEIYKQNMGGGGNETNEMDFMAHALDVVKMFMDKPQAQALPAQPQPSRLAPPIGRATTPPPPKPTTPPTPTQQGSVTPLNPPREIARSISEMDPRKAAETIIEALSYMPPDKQQAAIGSFLGEYQDIMGDDDGFEGDELGEEEDDDQRGVK